MVRSVHLAPKTSAPADYLKIGTLTAFQWLIYDSFKVSMGFPTTGLSADHE